MSLYYSKQTNGFYDTDFVDYDLPADAQEISEDQREELIKESMETTILNSQPAA